MDRPRASAWQQSKGEAVSASVIEIDLQRLDHNVRVLRRLAGPDVALCCVVKADGYGLGAPRIARRLQLASNVDLLAVYTLDQAEELLRANVSAPILVLMPAREIPRTGLLYRAAVSGKLHCVVHDDAHLSDLIRIADGFGCILPIHVEVDTGMSRGGLNPGEAPALLRRIAQTRGVKLGGFFTHFACSDASDEATRGQLQAFHDLVARLGNLIPPTCRLHAANTHAALRDSQYHLDMIRVGLAWAGYGPDELQNVVRLAAADDLLPIMTWKSAVVHTKWIESRTAVGYGRTWVARRRTRLGLVPVGYADGYPVGLSNKGVVRVFAGGAAATNGVVARAANGQMSAAATAPSAGGRVFEAPVVGRVSMDQITIDLTDVPESLAGVGAEVEIVGHDPALPNHLTTLAAHAKVLPYTILCGLSARIPRVYRHQADDATTTTGLPAALGAAPQPAVATVQTDRLPARLLKANHPAA